MSLTKVTTHQLANSIVTTDKIASNAVIGSANNADYLGGVAANQYAFANAITTPSSLQNNGYSVALSSSGDLSLPGNISGNTSGYTIGYLDLPQNYTNTSFTIALSDRGKHIYTSNGTSQTITIANNTNVQFPVGTAISIVVHGAGSVTVARETGVSLYLAANNTDANRTIASYGMATILKVAADTWFINGSGVS